jgi:hypothetical protein
VGFLSKEPPPLPKVDCYNDAQEPEDEPVNEFEVMRSISIVPEESCLEAMVVHEEGGRGHESVRSPATCVSRGLFDSGNAQMSEMMGESLDPTAKLLEHYNVCCFNCQMLPTPPASKLCPWTPFYSFPLICMSRSTFVKGSFILESVVSAHEIIHDTVNRKEKGLMIKLDYEKTYDRVNWHFLEEVLSTRGFSDKWISWVMKLVKGSYIAIRLNDRNSHYFQPMIGLRQGDHLSPLLFNLVADVFTRMMSKAASKGYLGGLMRP